MKHRDAIRAYRAIGELKTVRLPYIKARAVYEVAKQLEAEYRFYAEQEALQVKEYAHKDGEGKPVINGTRITFDTRADAQNYADAVEKLNDTEIQARITPVKLTDEELDGGNISAEAIEALTVAGVVVFGEG